MMKIVVLDGHTLNPGDISWQPLSALGTLTVHERTPAHLAAERIGSAEAVFVNKTPLPKEVIGSCPHLKFIGVLATGYNVVDVGFAKEKGISVCNVPAYGSDIVSQFAVGMLLEICHRIGHHSVEVKKGRWAEAPDWCFWDSPQIELAGKTAGIIGYGNIGQRTGEILQAFKVKVLAYDTQPNAANEGPLCRYADLDHIFAHSDFIFLHCPLFPSTQGMINKINIAKMKDGVIIINNSRGALIAEQDLAEALNSGKVGAAALDVLCVEPPSQDNPLLGAKNCYITPHIAWASQEARARILEISSENLKKFLKGTLQNCVNP